jgi:hypothetical protein
MTSSRNSTHVLTPGRRAVLVRIADEAWPVVNPNQLSWLAREGYLTLGIRILRKQAVVLTLKTWTELGRERSSTDHFVFLPDSGFNAITRGTNTAKDEPLARRRR